MAGQRACRRWVASRPDGQEYAQLLSDSWGIHGQDNGVANNEEQDDCWDGDGDLML